MPDSLLEPLAAYYAAREHRLPDCEQVQPDDMPQPHRELLVHEKDMTPTLESYHKLSLVLRPLQVWREDGILRRTVVLQSEDEEQAIEFGAIRIVLKVFSPTAREEVVGCHTPLGTILGKFGIDHQCNPSAYLKLTADDIIADALRIDAGTTLYGRRNGLTLPDGGVLADVVEILPPVAAKQSETQA